MFFSNTVISQSVCSSDSSKYLAAFNYIKSDTINKGIDFYVSDMIVDMDRFWFRSDLLKIYPKELATIDSLQKYEWFDDFRSCVINSLFGNKNRKSKSILFFSTIDKNTLRADLIYDRMYETEYKYDVITMFNTSPIYAYLFFFNSDNTIKLVFRTPIIYN